MGYIIVCFLIIAAFGIVFGGIVFGDTETFKAIDELLARKIRGEKKEESE